LNFSHLLQPQLAMRMRSRKLAANFELSKEVENSFAIYAI
jgi:hypothetical protein